LWKWQRSSKKTRERGLQLREELLRFHWFRVRVLRPGAVTEDARLDVAVQQLHAEGVERRACGAIWFRMSTQ
jgi:hypothetical protein